MSGVRRLRLDDGISARFEAGHTQTAYTRGDKQMSDRVPKDEMKDITGGVSGLGGFNDIGIFCNACQHEYPGSPYTRFAAKEIVHSLNDRNIGCARCGACDWTTCLLSLK